MTRSLVPFWRFTVLLVLAAGCDSPRTSKSFVFDAMDINEDPVPCMIVIDDDWEGAVERRQFVNVEANRTLVLEMAPEAAETTVTLAPLSKSDPTKKIPKSAAEAREISGFQDQVRKLRRTDPDRQLFVVSRRMS